MAERVFKYGDQSWQDPGQEFSNEDVRQQLVNVFPELARADIVTTDLEDGRVQVEFIKRAGTKGQDGQNPPTPLNRFVDAFQPILEQESGMVWGGHSIVRMVRWALKISGLELAAAPQSGGEGEA